MLVCDFAAGLVGLVVFRDAFLVGGAVFQRASSLGWKV
jgi:cardiolipin synthase